MNIYRKIFKLPAFPIYGVVINPETLEVDLEATESLRKKMKGRCLDEVKES